MGFLSGFSKVRFLENYALSMLLIKQKGGSICLSMFFLFFVSFRFLVFLSLFLSLSFSLSLFLRFLYIVLLDLAPPFALFFSGAAAAAAGRVSLCKGTVSGAAID